MTRGIRYIAAIAIMMTLGVVCANNVQAKYVESKTLTVALDIEKHYEVEFDANGGFGSMANQEFTAGAAQTLSANLYTNGDYYFNGWNTSADGLGTAYGNEQLITTDLTNIGGDVVTLYAQWGASAMQTVFEINGECSFNAYEMKLQTGDGYITGTNCTSGGVNWADGTHKYIDTGIKLYDSTNYEKDYEVGFTITRYDYTQQYQSPGESSIQSTFFSDKLENSARHWPGIAIRKNDNKIEITETITKPNGSYEKKTNSSSSVTPVKIVITRVDEVVYYSVNDGTFTPLQDNHNTTDYFDMNAWFGAAAKEDGTPFRYVDATMTDMYIKIGEKGVNKHTVSFDAGGVVADPSDATIIGNSKIGASLPNMPNYVDTPDGRLYFIGWYTGIDGAGEKYTENTIVNQDITLHAFWHDELVVCRVSTRTQDDLQECINDAGIGETVVMLEDIKKTVSVADGKDITLDLNGHKLSDNGGTSSTPIIENSGKLTVVNGTITSVLRAGVINNNGTGELYVGNDARILATGSRQAIYNKGGKVEIDGNAYLSAKSGERATLQSLDNGQVVIKSGTIISVNQEAVKIESGTLEIGEEDGAIDSTTPILQGATYGLNTSVNVSMFDGKLRGKSKAINDTSRITTTETGATSVGIDTVVTEVIDNETYKIIYYQ